LVAQGDLCRAAGDADCACAAYLEALRMEANPSARAGWDALACEPFARPYAFASGLETADEIPRGERGGLVIAAGLGNQFSGFGAHLAYYVRAPASPFAIAPYLGAGVQPGGDGYSAVTSAVAGVTGMLGGEDRWLLDASAGAVGMTRLELHGASVATRAVHGVSLSLGREWMWRSGVLVRVLLGASYVIDAGWWSANVWPALSFGLGWKPW
jgi:hypothetical protein